MALEMVLGLPAELVPEQFGLFGASQHFVQKHYKLFDLIPTNVFEFGLVEVHNAVLKIKL